MVPPLRHSQADLPAFRWGVGIGGFREWVIGGNEERFWWDEDKGFRLVYELPVHSFLLRHCTCVHD